MKKIVFTCVLFLGLSMTGFAQSDKLKEKATEKVEELNAQIISIDKSLSLTDAQKGKILTLQIERMKELRKSKKNGGDKDDDKAINKKYFDIIFNEVLTKAQKRARTQAKKQEKD